MKVVILSAGQGRRLLPLTADRPKCALPVQGRSVLQWQLDQIAKCQVSANHGLSEVVVVTGFEAGRVDEIIQAGGWAVPVRTLYNPFYHLTDNLGTCWVAREAMHEPFVLLNGDTLFEGAVLHRLLTSPPRYPITLAVDHKSDYDDDDMKVSLADGRLLRVGKDLPSARVDGESIGMMVFRDEGPSLFRVGVEAAMRQRSGLSRWYLSVIDQLAAGHKVGSCGIQGLSWCEIDDQQDLASAADVVMAWPEQTAQSVAAGGL